MHLFSRFANLYLFTLIRNIYKILNLTFVGHLIVLKSNKVRGRFGLYSSGRKVYT